MIGLIFFGKVIINMICGLLIIWGVIILESIWIIKW